MSWDVSVLMLSQNYDSVGDIPEDESAQILGTRTHVQLIISKHFPATNWGDPAWGIFDSKDGSIEFNIGNEETDCSGFMMHVRASERIVPGIIGMCLENNWQALDCSSGEFLEKAENPTAGLNSWQEYKDQILGREV